ncbi:MAG TPA: 6-phosphogluconolactonase [Candidatus Obscuribacterales bacterium]
MKRIKFSDYESLSVASAQEILSLVRRQPDAKICLPTGATPERTYELLAELDGGRSFRQARMVQLDEWGGLSSGAEGTCDAYLRHRVLDPLHIDENHYTSFRSDAPDPSGECRRIQRELDLLGPMDLCLLGLGKNGHLGLNEPGPYLTPRVHVAQLTDASREHSMLSKSKAKPTFGYTLGMGDLLRSKMILLLVSGEQKSQVLSRLMKETVETDFPASFLWLHPNVLLHCDI